MSNVVKENIGTGFYNNRVVSNVNGGFHIQEQHDNKTWRFYIPMTDRKPAKYSTMEEAVFEADRKFDTFN